jgi:DNA modification methylase
MDIELRRIDQIKPYDKNPRDNDEAVDAVANSITTFGFRQPIVVDGDGVIVVGHTRYKAAQKLGMEEVPVHVADLSPSEAKAYRIADNQTANIATWDKDLLPLELKGLEEMNFDLSTLGFGEEELKAFMSGDITAGLVDPDEVPAPPDKAITQPGDLWVLGDHRLLCGDSSKPEDVDRLLDGAKIQLVNTDPPYNVDVQPRSNVAIAAGLSSFPATENTTSTKGARKLRAKDRSITNDKMSDADFDKMLRKWFGNLSRVLDPGGSFYIWGGYGNCGSYPPALKESELYFSQAVIWVKEHPVMNRKDFMGNHEWCFHGWKKGAGHRFFGPHNITDVWSVKKVPSQQMEHLTQKPVELAVRAMQYSSLAGENVLDLFGGSGSTLIGAEQTGRKSFVMELDPLYCDVIVQRWEKFSGKSANRLDH